MTLFGPFIRLKNLPKSFGIVQLMVKQRRSLCFAFICNSTENTSFLQFGRFYCVFQWKSNQNSSKIHKITFCMQRSMCKKVTNFKSLKVSKLITYAYSSRNMKLVSFFFWIFSQITYNFNCHDICLVYSALPGPGLYQTWRLAEVNIELYQ